MSTLRANYNNLPLRIGPNCSAHLGPKIETAPYYKIALRFVIVLASFLALVSASHSASVEPPSSEAKEQLRQAISSTPSFSDRFDAEVWLVDMSSRLERHIQNPQERLAILRLVHHYATQAQISPQLVLSVIEVESRFDRFAISSAGAQGLMQVMPFWKKEIGTPQDNLTHIETNLKYGCSILSHYLKKEKGGLIQALARYNGSYNQTWYPERVLLAWEKHWFIN